MTSACIDVESYRRSVDEYSAKQKCKKVLLLGDSGRE